MLHLFLMDDFDLYQFLFELEVFFYFKIDLLLIGFLQMFCATDVGVVEVRELYAIFAAELLDLAAEPIDAVVDIIDYAIFLQLKL